MKTRQQGGYVLLATLVLLALLAIVAGRLSSRVDQLRAQTSGLSAYADGLVRVQSARATILWRLATSYAGPGGFTGRDGVFLSAGSRPVALVEGVEITLQDHRGLASLNAANPALLRHLLIKAGLPDNRVAHLLDALLDYTDTDGLSRLNGAEAGIYVEKGLPAPRNGWLESPEELRQIVGWVAYPEVLDRVIPWVSNRRDILLNPNTAPREVLQAWLPQLLPSQIESIVQRRSIAPLLSPASLRDLVGTSLDRDDVVFYVGETSVLTVRDKALPLSSTYNVLLTPASPLAPWIILDSRVVPTPRSDEPSPGVPAVFERLP